MFFFFFNFGTKKTFLSLASAKITDFYGLRDFEVDFKQDSPVSVLIAPNGYGKTTLMHYSFAIGCVAFAATKNKCTESEKNSALNRFAHFFDSIFVAHGSRKPFESLEFVFVSQPDDSFSTPDKKIELTIKIEQNHSRRNDNGRSCLSLCVSSNSLPLSKESRKQSFSDITDVFDLSNRLFDSIKLIKSDLDAFFFTDARFLNPIVLNSNRLASSSPDIVFKNEYGEEDQTIRGKDDIQEIESFIDKVNHQISQYRLVSSERRFCLLYEALSSTNWRDVFSDFENDRVMFNNEFRQSQDKLPDNVRQILDLLDMLTNAYSIGGKEITDEERNEFLALVPKESFHAFDKKMSESCKKMMSLAANGGDLNVNLIKCEIDFFRQSNTSQEKVGDDAISSSSKNKGTTELSTFSDSISIYHAKFAFDSITKDQGYKLSFDSKNVSVLKPNLKKHQYIPFSIGELSYGEKNLVIVLLKVICSQKDGIAFYLDEPEISLHIQWQENFLDAIIPFVSGSSGSRQLVIATHSPYIAEGHENLLVHFKDA
jgi:predicted ATPase